MFGGNEMKKVKKSKRTWLGKNDENIFSFMRVATRSLQEVGREALVKEMEERVRRLEDYYNALKIIDEYMDCDDEKI